ncbi:hypothetical protein D3C73_1084540 [compost metagenome]
MGHRAVLVNSDAHALHGARQATYQFRRVNGGDVGRKDAAIGLGDPDLLRQLLGAEPAVLALAQALLVKLVQILAQAGFLFGIACSAVQRPALAVITVDAFTFEHDFHFIRNAVQQFVGSTALLRRQIGQQAVFTKDIAHQPAAVATGRAKTGGLRFDDGDIQARRLPLEVIGRPQAGVASTNDSNVDIQVALQCRARQQRLVQLIHPQTDITPRWHARPHHSNVRWR